MSVADLAAAASSSNVREWSSFVWHCEHFLNLWSLVVVEIQTVDPNPCLPDALTAEARRRPGLMPGIADELVRRFEATWDHGANFIVGWRMADDGMSLLHLPCHGLSDAAATLPDLLNRDRYVGTDERWRRMVAAGCTVERFPLTLEPDDAARYVINDLLRRFTVTHTKSRAAALFDIVNFSLNSTYDQIAQLSFLSHCINLATAHCAAKGFPIEVRSTTTGDGFYLWNHEEGFLADVAVYFVVALTLVANNSVRRDDRLSRAAPTLRCAIGFGGNIEYTQATGGKENEFIVGDVTISLARLVAMALPGQVLVASRTRELDARDDNLRRALDTDTLDTSTFIALAQGFVDRAIGLRLPTGASIAQTSAYLTGERISDREFTIRKFVVVDKHGLEHRCFNLKFNARDSGGRHIFVGLQDDELSDFEARHVEAEDILVRLA